MILSVRRGGDQSADFAGGGGSAGGSAGRGVSRLGGGQPPGRWEVSRGGGSVSGGGVSQDSKIGQQNGYSPHGGQYASCVHVGGLSCFNDGINYGERFKFGIIRSTHDQWYEPSEWSVIS